MRKELFEDLFDSVQEGVSILKGEKEPSRTFVLNVPDIKELREKKKMSQAELASLIGISVKTLQNWEQRRRVPRGPAVRLLQIISTDLNAVRKALEKIKKAESTA
ncbi:NadS family protein [Desulfomonile tiedjei]|uniref:Putative transcriptional regulator n=1 Tax=Desulfomonile tiedjei (strain ATCC 49306 / DSM 6799 / DCB-1) TaxID=706587 RepID=I4C9I3_DESTA|nr:NadS family protein [Desulfomonile tiedjei]AFM26224.1 putative transcriptional regulator [Desulfomonile tiedjei DSM 6799]